MTSKRILWWLPTIIYIGFIMFMATQPAPRLPARQLDKAVHFGAYAVLAFLSYHSLRKSGVKGPAAKAAVLGLLIGMLDESLQQLSPYRTASLLDLLADLAGASCGAFAASYVRLRLTTRS